MDADRVTLGAREVVSAPLSADFTLPKTSGSPCVSVPVLMDVGVDTGSRNTGLGPGFLKGVLVIVSNWLRKEGRTKGLGVAIEMGSGVGPEGGVGNSFLLVPPLALPVQSILCQSGPVALASLSRMPVFLPPPTPLLLRPPWC